MFAWKFTLLAFPVSTESKTIKTGGMYVVLTSHFKQLLTNFVCIYWVSLQMVYLFSCILCGEISTYQKKLKYEYSIQM